MSLRTRLTAVVLTVLPVFSVAAEPVLFPTPSEITRSEGNFRLSETTSVYCAQTEDAPCADAVKVFVGWLYRARGLKLSQVQAGPSPAIVLRRSADLAGEEYRLSISPAGVNIVAGGDAGLFYGLVSLFSLATPHVEPSSNIDLPSVSIADKPRYSWRGVMLDSVRHFQSPEAVKALIDAMALHKLNVLHWHLTDDQGWRIEIKRYPQLTARGAFRHNAREGRYGGFYTQEQIRDIVAYAKVRAVTIVPEIEMPGHALAAVVAYPKLGSAKPPNTSIMGDWGIFPYLYNVDESTFSFLEGVLTEVMALFPSEFIHIGGDEAPKDQWNASRRVQQRMKALGVPDANALQGYFTARIGQFLQSRGRRLIGWDEILEGKPPSRAAVMSWRTVESATEAAEQGRDVVMSPAPTYYLDYCQALRDGEPTCRGELSSLRTVFDFDPSPSGALKRHLLGVQANIWTEHMPSSSTVFKAAFPRVAALAETGWSTSKNWEAFISGLPVQFARYRSLGIVYSDAAYRVDVRTQLTNEGALVTLSNQAGIGAIHYTLNGRAPAIADPVYTKPFTVALPVQVQAATFISNALVGRITVMPLNAAAVLRRTSWEMEQCTNDLPLAQRARKPVMVNVMNPCWIYRGMDLGHISSLKLSLVRLPFNYQIGADIKKIPVNPKAPRPGRLEVRLDTCHGPLLGQATLGRKRLDVKLKSQLGNHDICLNTVRRSVDPIWAIDWVQPMRTK